MGCLQIWRYHIFFFIVLPLCCYQPISLHPYAHMLSHVIPWTSARQTLLSMDFSRQEYWSGLPFPSPEISYLNTAVSEWRFQQRPTPCLQASLIYLAGIKHIHIYIFHTINEIICLELGRSLALAVNLQGSHWVFFLRLDKGRAAETYLGTQGFSASSTS